MDGHKRYTLWLVSLVSAQMLALLAASFHLEPLLGDLTRLGGYAENDFGWNRPQRVFPGAAPPLRPAYEEYSDILVVGDSFSFAGNFGVLNYPWQTFLAAKTGLSVATVSHYTKTEPLAYDPEALPRIVGSEAFLKTPPRVLIMEVVERQLGILPDPPGDCRARQALDASPVFSLRPAAGLAASEEAARNKTLPPLKEQMAYAKKYLGRLFPLPWDKAPIVSRLALADGALFSNRQSGEMLVFNGDLEKRAWDAAKVEGIRCKLVKMQNLVQKNGKTLFVAMVVPDKLTAYSKYLRDRSLANLGVIERLAADPSLHLPRIDLAVKAAVDSGAVDVYLPNDTHWAYRGHEAAAEALAGYLRQFSEK